MEHMELYERILASYEKTHSVQKTAEELGTSTIKVRRVLITEGQWSSATSRKIMLLWEQGLSTAEIAERLHSTAKNVQAFLPYTKGTYGREYKSANSIRSKEYRQRNQQTAENQVGAAADIPKGFVRSEQLPREHDANYGARPVALKLHLELNTTDCSAQELNVLHTFGKMETAISRDLIVPSDMTLHALHYAIQKLFGWQNEHLHHYEFPVSVFNALTQRRFSRWCSLAGIYFRFPDEEMYDLFWDDDYEPDMSIKTWFRKKYKGPYFYGGLGDYYYENQRKVLAFKHKFPSFEVRPTFQEFMQSERTGKKPALRIASIKSASIDEVVNTFDLGGDVTHLLERLTLMEYLFLPHNDYYLDPIDEKITYLEDGLKSSIKAWDTMLQNIDRQYDAFCFLAQLTTVRMQAQSSKINYYYDYGDGWEVSVELTEAYYADHAETHAEPALCKVISEHMPVCVKADGLPVLDDVGGIHGYVDFLREMHHDSDKAAKDDARDRARSLGWTGRMIQPKNLL